VRMRGSHSYYANCRGPSIFSDFRVATTIPVDLTYLQETHVGECPTKNLIGSLMILKR
jgi:hypothetical protein